MRIQKTLSSTKYILDPGDHYVSDKPIVISTLLGSCVAACLYDPINRVMAMNHFLLSNNRFKKEGSIITTEAGRYGIHAMELIVNGMLKFGAKKQNIKAKAFGGGNVLYQSMKSDNSFNIGEINSRFIVEFLENEKIPLVSSDLGGVSGRVILFFGSDYSVYVRKIETSETTKIIERDRDYWKSSLKDQQKISSDIELWNH